MGANSAESMLPLPDTVCMHTRDMRSRCTEEGGSPAVTALESAQGLSQRRECGYLSVVYGASGVGLK